MNSPSIPARRRDILSSIIVQVGISMHDDCGWILAVNFLAEYGINKRVITRILKNAAHRRGYKTVVLQWEQGP